MKRVGERRYPTGAKGVKRGGALRRRCEGRKTRDCTEATAANGARTTKRRR